MGMGELCAPALGPCLQFSKASQHCGTGNCPVLAACALLIHRTSAPTETPTSSPSGVERRQNQETNDSVALAVVALDGVTLDGVALISHLQCEGRRTPAPHHIQAPCQPLPLILETPLGQGHSPITHPPFKVAWAESPWHIPSSVRLPKTGTWRPCQSLPGDVCLGALTAYCLHLSLSIVPGQRSSSCETLPSLYLEGLGGLCSSCPCPPA